MKNAKILLGIGVLVLVGAGYLGLQYFQNNIAEEVEALLLQNNMSSSAVSYDTFEDTLTIKDLQGKDILYKDSTVHIQNITIKGPNIQAFTDVNAPMPKVADQIYFENIKGNIMIFGQDNELHVASVTIKNWKQNIAVALVAKDREGFSEAFFKALLNMEIDSVNYTDHKMRTKDANFDTNNTTKNTEITGITPQGIAHYLMEDTLITSTDLQSGIKTDMHLGSLLAKNSPMPSPELMLLLTTLSNKKLDNIDATEMEKLMLAVMDNVTLSPKQEYTLTNLSSAYFVNNEKKEMGSIQQIEVLFDIDTAKIGNISTALKINDFSFDSVLLDHHRQDQELINGIFGSSHMHFDLGLKAQLASDATSSLQAQITVANDTNITTQLDFLFNQESYVAAIQNIASEILVDKALDDIRLSAFKLHMQDKNILHNTLMAFSKMQNIPAEHLHAGFMQQIHASLAEFAPILGQEGVTAIEQCLQAPGTLDISAQPEQALSPVAAFALSLANPSKLNIKSTCTPGKSILEAR